MVEYVDPLNFIFHSLADGTRRDILKRLSRAEQTVSELAKPYTMSLAAIAKHIGVLERAGLVTKRRSGKERVVHIAPAAIKTAEAHLSEYERLWSARFDALEELLNKDSDSETRWQPSRSQSPSTRRTSRGS